MSTRNKITTKFGLNKSLNIQNCPLSIQFTPLYGAIEKRFVNLDSFSFFDLIRLLVEFTCRKTEDIPHFIRDVLCFFVHSTGCRMFDFYRSVCQKEKLSLPFMFVSSALVPQNVIKRGHKRKTPSTKVKGANCLRCNR
jgi:hypothetical protein